MAGSTRDIEDLLPPKPRAPQPSDCCGSGCCPCVHDIYEEDLKTWRRRCDQIRNGIEEEVTGKPIDTTHWTDFEIIGIVEVSASTFSYRFRVPDNRCLGIRAGQHLVLKQVINGRIYTRQYTPVTDLNQRGYFDVLIKIYENGRVTRSVKNWRKGDLIPWRGPYGDFAYAPGRYKRIVMLAAGTGIAPMYQITKAVVENEEEETRVYLMYACKSFSDVLLRCELEELSRYWNFAMRYYLSEETDVNAKKRYKEEVEARKMTKEEVKEQLEGGPLTSTLVLVCGTKSFEKDMINAAKNANVPDENIYKF